MGSDDTAHIAHALNTARIVVTHDGDFLRLAALGVEHFGIAYCHQDKYTIGELISRLLALAECYEAENTKGQVEYL